MALIVILVSASRSRVTGIKLYAISDRFIHFRNNNSVSTQQCFHTIQPQTKLKEKKLDNNLTESLLRKKNVYF